jgi:hypothetical protein
MNKEEWMSLLLMMFNFFFCFFSKTITQRTRDGLYSATCCFLPSYSLGENKVSHAYQSRIDLLATTSASGWVWMVFVFSFVAVRRFYDIHLIFS